MKKNDSNRLQEFEEEIQEIDTSSGKANPEKKLLILGIVLGVGGLVLVFAAFLVARSVGSVQEQNETILMGFLGLCLIFIGTVLYVTNKLTRFFRYWLVRLIYEHRAQIDRLEKN